MKSWIIRLAALAIVGSPLPWVRSGVAADEPKAANPAPPAAEKLKGPDNPLAVASVNAFLDALKAHDLDRLARVTALRAPHQAESEKNTKLFTEIREMSLSDENLGRLADEFKGYEIVGTERLALAKVAVLVERPGVDGNRFERTIIARKEKAGWKVLDFSEPRELAKP